MCGRKPCRACARKAARVSGTKRKKMARRKKNDIVGQLTNVGIAAIGYIAIDQLNKVPYLSANPQMLNYAKLGVGTYLAMTSKNPMLVSAAQGAALNGAIGVGRQFGVVSGIGQVALPFGRYGSNSAAIPGVAGGKIKVR